MIYLIKSKPVAGILEGLTHWLQTMGTASGAAGRDSRRDDVAADMGGR